MSLGSRFAKCYESGEALSSFLQYVQALQNKNVQDQSVLFMSDMRKPNVGQPRSPKCTLKLPLIPNDAFSSSIATAKSHLNIETRATPTTTCCKRIVHYFELTAY